MKNFKIRASAAGKLMTNPRNKADKLSQTTISYLKEWYLEDLYGIKNEIESKYIKKGIELEDEAINAVIEWLNLPFLLKNEQSFEDDVFTGTPDLILDDEVIDIKVSWDVFTFPILETEIPTPDYYYQLQIYMHLTGKRKARLVYVLLDTPANLDWRGITYEGVPTELRVKAFEVDYDESVIAKLTERVEDSRDFLKKINKQIRENK